MKLPVARKLAVRHTKRLTIISKCMLCLQACLFKYIIVSAFRIYALHGEDVTKRGGLRSCLK